jgi:YHS domain-containing protein
MPSGPGLAATEAFGGQKTCPVSGALLANASNPVAVSVRGQTIYVCCQGCAAKLQQNPDAYLARAATEHAVPGTLTMHLPDSARNQPFGGQKTCPVTDAPLDAQSAIPVSVRGQTVYVCCQGCASKLARNPDRYLPKVMAERASWNNGQP